MEQPNLVIEPGRSIIGPAGVALYRIGAIKEIPGVRTYVSVDGGMGDNIRPALYQASYEVLSANRPDAEPDATVTIAGKYCESGDVLASDVLLPTPAAGDVIAIPAAGAYCPSMASNYNLNPRPPIVHGQWWREPPHPPPRILRRHDALRLVALLCGKPLVRTTCSVSWTPACKPGAWAMPTCCPARPTSAK